MQEKQRARYEMHGKAEKNGVFTRNGVWADPINSIGFYVIRTSFAGRGIFTRSAIFKKLGFEGLTRQRHYAIIMTERTDDGCFPVTIKELTARVESRGG